MVVYALSLKVEMTLLVDLGKVMSQNVVHLLPSRHHCWWPSTRFTKRNVGVFGRCKKWQRGPSRDTGKWPHLIYRWCLQTEAYLLGGHYWSVAALTYTFFICFSFTYWVSGHKLVFWTETAEEEDLSQRLNCCVNLPWLVLTRLVSLHQK